MAHLDVEYVEQRIRAFRNLPWVVQWVLLEAQNNSIDKQHQKENDDREQACGIHDHRGHAHQ